MSISYIFRLIISAAITSLCLCCCSGNKAERKSALEQRRSPIVAFCEGIDYADTASLHDKDKMDARMADLVKLMMRSDTTDTKKALAIFLMGLNGDETALRTAAEKADLYLNSPNSPAKDETLYLLFLRSMLKAHDLPEDVAARTKDRIFFASLNRPGTKANDFNFIDRDGLKNSLYSVGSEKTLLIFYDPECPHCPEILERIAKNKKVNAAIEEGSLQVVAVYAEGKRDVWDKTKRELPENWTVAYDLTGVLDEELYDLPAMPYVFLLDADKKVLIKDMPF
ncbi:MAG: DUF5106 domain-containing protein [Muribaculaceae bacterium]|nr:DUF5106 domain-containing protein [Muribaculaceae bacterium]